MTGEQALQLQWNIDLQHKQQLNIIPEVTATKPPYRILCWVLTDPNDLERRTKYVRDTWARRCDKMLFMSSAHNDSFPTIGLNVTAGRNHIGAKAKAAWLYIYEHYRNDAEYFLKGDPDTYFVVDNLRRYLATRDPAVPEFFGHRLYLKGANVTYVSGGSGLVISRESLERLNYALIHTPTCIPDGQGQCVSSEISLDCQVKVKGKYRSCLYVVCEETLESFYLYFLVII